VKQTTLINIYAGAGAGKSTTAAQVFATLKLAGTSCELVTEYVKDWAWRGRHITEWDDVYLFAKQVQRQSAVYGKVDYLITDSPIGLAHVYERMYPRPGSAEIMLPLVREYERRQEAAGIVRVNCLLKRTKPYVAAGRFEDAAGAARVDGICEDFLRMNASRPFHFVTDAADVIRVAGVPL
jgi:hypothetical protein